MSVVIDVTDKVTHEKIVFISEQIYLLIFSKVNMVIKRDSFYVARKQDFKHKVVRVNLDSVFTVRYLQVDVAGGEIERCIEIIVDGV